MNDSIIYPAMTIGQLHTAIKRLFKDCIAFKWSDYELNKRLTIVRGELISRTKSGKRRYPVIIEGYVKGFIAAYHDDLISNHLEFCYERVIDGKKVLFSTDKHTSKRSSKELHELMLSPDEWNIMRKALVYKDSDKWFSHNN